MDVTSAIAGDGTYSFRISDSVGGADYSSKEGANALQLVLTLGGTPVATNTPTLTPTPGPSPTPTNTLIPTATFTPGPSAIFSNATLTYDGDGKRVKSVITTNVGTTTTYFVGAHYEVADGVVTKYYYAGVQRIAMRTNGTLNFLLGDHLGSTSLTTDASGQVVSELRYKAWGEVRYASGDTPTRYQYTGQYSYAGEFGLLFYNARWYDGSLGRFAQADTIIPPAQGTQGWDRYAYVNNSPIRYTDPTGHRACGDGEAVDCDGYSYTPPPPNVGCGVPGKPPCGGNGGGGSGGGGSGGNPSPNPLPVPDPSPAPTTTPTPTATLPTPTVTSTGTQTQPASIIENYCGNNSSLACIAMFAQDTATMIDLVGAGTEVALIAIGCFAGGPSGCVAGVGVSWELWNVPIVGPISLNGAETTLSITSGVLTVIDDAQDNEFGDATVTAVVTNIVGGISPDPIIDLFIDGYGTGYSHGVFNGILTIWNGGPLIP